MKKIRIIFFIMLALVGIVFVSIILCKKVLNTDHNNETFYNETFYTYEETELGNETEISSEDYMPTEEK